MSLVRWLVRHSVVVGRVCRASTARATSDLPQACASATETISPTGGHKTACPAPSGVRRHSREHDQGYLLCPLEHGIGGGQRNVSQTQRNVRCGGRIPHVLH